MKVIDLLNKIANGEQVPKKIKYCGREYKFDEYKGERGFVDKNIYPYKWFAKEIDCDLKEDLNDEVEIIEEDKKIEMLEYYDNSIMWCMNGREITDNEKDIIDKINEIIDYINGGTNGE